LKHAWGYGSQQRLRETNEDSFGVFRIRDLTLAIVCDGMGGHHGGQYASALAVRVIHDAFHQAPPGSPTRSLLQEAIEKANRAIFEASRKSHELIGMGTTVVVAVVQDQKATIAHVGDSRLYVIRGTEAAQMTRDHTMVNLFVDAELLSPEDAESHPEAHVLSRSLGVERVVDVDMQADLDLYDGDRLLLCTDGVHGVFTEWEIAGFDWSEPQDGIDKVLNEVANREGADNATAAVIAIGENVRRTVPPSELPQVDADLPRARTVSPTAKTAPGFQGAATRAPPPIPSPVIAPRPILDDGPAPDRAPPAVTAEAPSIAAPTPQRQESQRPEAQAPAPAQPIKPKPSAMRKLAPAIATLFVAALGTAVLGIVALVFINNNTSTEETNGAGIVEIEPAIDTPPAPPSDSVVSAAPAASRSVEGMFFAPSYDPILPEIHRPSEHTHPPPGGTFQVDAVRAARAGRCGKSMETVVEAMNASIDYARLYLSAWECYTVRHRDKLQTARLASAGDFSTVLEHFQGAPAAVLTPEQAKVPAWRRPATDGIEHRLEHFAASNPETDMLADVMDDYLGPVTLGAELARDVLIEADAAAAFATAWGEPREAGRPGAAPLDDAQIEAWARRVYYTTWAMNGTIGSLIRAQQPDQAVAIRETLRKALPGVDIGAPPMSEREYPRDLGVPLAVFQAYQAALPAANLLTAEVGPAPAPGVRRPPPIGEPVVTRGQDASADVPRVHRYEDQEDPE
jgi:protein phosphatase